MNKHAESVIYHVLNRARGWVDGNAEIIAIVSSLYLIYCWFFTSMTLFDKVMSTITVVIPNFFVLGQRLVIGYVNAGSKVVLEGIPHFYERAFSRKLLSSTISFAKSRKDLEDTALFIDSNPVFLGQFPDPQRRVELYSNWNRLTGNKAVVQVFSPDGKNRIGASVILPLSKQGYKRLVGAEKSEQFGVLQSLGAQDIELSNSRSCVYLVDILLVDVRKCPRDQEPLKKGKLLEYLSGLSLHVSLWHLSHINTDEMKRLPCILLQPDVDQIVRCTYSAAGFVKPSSKNVDFHKAPVAGDYLEMNQKVARQIIKKGDKEKEQIFRRCLEIIDLYKYGS